MFLLLFSLQNVADRRALLYLAGSYAKSIEGNSSDNVTTRTITYTASSGNLLFLLSSMATTISCTFGIDFPKISDPTSVNTITSNLTMVVETTFGIQMVHFGLGGNFGPTALAAKFGATWPLGDSLFTLKDPYIEYTALPSTLTLGFTITVPILNIKATTATMSIQRDGIQLQVSSRA